MLVQPGRFLGCTSMLSKIELPVNRLLAGIGWGLLFP
jgi:hypothetical protein